MVRGVGRPPQAAATGFRSPAEDWPKGPPASSRAGHRERGSLEGGEKRPVRGCGEWAAGRPPLAARLAQTDSCGLAGTSLRAPQRAPQPAKERALASNGDARDPHQEEGWGGRHPQAGPPTRPEAHSNTTMRAGGPRQISACEPTARAPQGGGAMTPGTRTRAGRPVPSIRPLGQGT